MFTESCFIRKNTYDLRHSLNDMGKTNCTQRVFPILISNYEIYYGVHDFEESIDNLMLNGFIDCGTNEELFLAIAALRDDSDKFQYFTNGVFWIKCSQLELKHELDNNYEEFCVADFHKATVEELIKRFEI